MNRPLQEGSEGVPEILSRQEAISNIAGKLAVYGNLFTLHLRDIPAALLSPFEDGETVIAPGRVGGSIFFVCRVINGQKVIVMEERAKKQI